MVWATAQAFNTQRLAFGLGNLMICSCRIDVCTPTLNPKPNPQNPSPKCQTLNPKLQSEDDDHDDYYYCMIFITQMIVRIVDKWSEHYHAKFLVAGFWHSSGFHPRIVNPAKPQYRPLQNSYKKPKWFFGLGLKR